MNIEREFSQIIEILNKFNKKDLLKLSEILNIKMDIKEFSYIYKYKIYKFVMLCPKLQGDILDILEKQLYDK